MAQGEWTKEEVEETRKAVEELFEAIPKSRRMGFLGHLNDIFLFLEAAKEHAPESKKVSGEGENEKVEKTT